MLRSQNVKVLNIFPRIISNSYKKFVKNQGKGFPAKKHQNHPAERLTVARVSVAGEIDLTRVGPHPWRVRGTAPTLGADAATPPSTGFPPHVAPATRGGKGPGSGRGGGGGGGAGGGGGGGLEDYAKTDHRQLLRYEAPSFLRFLSRQTCKMMTNGWTKIVDHQGKRFLLLCQDVQRPVGISIA